MTKPLLSPRATKISCYLGYITQAIVNNLVTLLFVLLHQDFGVTFSEISLLIVINFTVQISVDLLASALVDRVGYRITTVASNLFSACGLLLLSLLPGKVPSTFGALAAAYAIMAVGGGLTEVTISPIIESIPGGHKASNMSLLHSFYCWGQTAVVALSTLYFVLFGEQNWRILPLLWAIVPLLNALLCCFVPFFPLVEEGKGMKIRSLLATPIFWLLLAFMFLSGASELALSQWASLFAELGLQVDKTLGDLLGPCAFAILMGTSRVLFSVFGKKLKLPLVLFASATLCIASYLLAALSPLPILSLLGCALTGFAVGMMWPGTISVAGERLPRGGTAMFALLALAGDLGCTVGPALVGQIAENTDVSIPLFGSDPTVAGLKFGILLSVIFPLLLALCAFAMFLKERKKSAPSLDSERIH